MPAWQVYLPEYVKDELTLSNSILYNRKRMRERRVIRQAIQQSS